jgi:tetracycline 7-halogenase / FADH2 O2-dependent halogenase
MNVCHADVAILGSGFAGSLAALILDRMGLRPVLLERGRHPRFAIGESSTPIAGFVLRDLARAYGLPRIAPLAKYGTWKASCPQLACGLKRGFSYFRHEPRQPISPRDDHANELLVAASSDDVHGDVHWMRSDVDSFFVEEVQAAGIPYDDETDVMLRRDNAGWRITGVRHGEEIDVRARFVVDATGEAAVVPRALGITCDADGLKTHSRAIFAHFRNVRPWRDVLLDAGVKLDDHPFDCDRAAVHHVLDEGWMWQLPFDNGVTSAGFVLDAEQSPVGRIGNPSYVTPRQEWDELMQRYPSLREQFQDAEIVADCGGLQRTGRLQRMAHAMAGDGWALLPHTAGFIDPLHSTGIAHSLSGVARLARILADHWHEPTQLAAELSAYQQALWQELTLIDELVHGCYLARRQFRLFVAYSMLYFAAATTCERRWASGQNPELPDHPRVLSALLCADDSQFRSVVRELHCNLQSLLDGGRVDATQLAAFERSVAAAIAPYNTAGLCDADLRNMYRHTAVGNGDRTWFE